MSELPGSRILRGRSVMKQVWNIGNRREVFWDTDLLEEQQTTAFIRALQPVEREVCFVLDQGSETESVSYPNIVKTPEGYRMYYIVWSQWSEKAGVQLAVIESEDGIIWKRPHLELFAHPELEENNIVINELLDNAFVFYDPNPDCPSSERYKAICSHRPVREGTGYDSCLWCYPSADGYHFEEGWLLSEHGTFDTMNTVHYRDGRYACYIRDFHGFAPGEHRTKGIRDIRVMYSDDFHTWSIPEHLEYTDGRDLPMYTNNVIIYERAPHMLIGFPTRYCERKTWTQNNEQMGSAAIKKSVMEIEARLGLAVTDCVFMHSRDGILWNRGSEAFLTPGYESTDNWVYGDCYPACNLIDSGRETYYLYCHRNDRTQGKPKELVRYEIRKDGFACLMAGGKEAVAVTKPLIFEGKDLHLNFETSACGYLYVEVLDEDGNQLSEQESFEIYGNSIDRRICFADNTDFAAYSGKPVRLRFCMCDARLYSMWFT